MTGLVLCGGESKRMGRDKGLIMSGEKTWASVIAELLQVLGVPTYISVNKNSFSGYQQYFPVNQLLIDDESIGVAGPLTGLLTAHRHLPDEDIFVIACDMQIMALPIVQQLYEAYHRFPDNDIYLFTKDHEPEPLCAIYKIKALASTLTKFTSAKQGRFSMKSVLAEFKQYNIQLTPAQFNFFENFNSPEDLSRG